jgi:methionyl-tRNA formyltransferase
MNFYLKGYKGLAAAKALMDFPNYCNEIYLMKDLYTSVEEYREILTGLNLKNLKVIELLDNSKIEYSNNSLLVGWNRIVDTNNKNIFVIHDSILPKYRGWNPLVSALIKGESEVGATLFKADSGIDTGPVIRSKRIGVPEFISIAKAIDLVNPLITSLTLHLLKNSENFMFNYVEQDETSASFSLWRDEQDYYIDFARDSSYVLRHILASGSPYRGARAWLSGEEIVITGGRIVEDVYISNRIPGKVISIRGGNPTVVCGTGLLEITEAKYLNTGLHFFPFRKVKSRFTRLREF